jgi:hypothetical protein
VGVAPKQISWWGWQKDKKKILWWGWHKNEKNKRMMKVAQK